MVDSQRNNEVSVARVGHQAKQEKNDTAINMVEPQYSLG